MELVHWYTFIFNEQGTDEELKILLAKEFSVELNIAKQRIREIKEIKIQFSSPGWEKIDIIKELIYTYINNQPLSVIAISGMINELIVEDLIDRLSHLFESNQDLQRGLFNYNKKNIKFISQKIDFLENFNYLKDNSE